MDATTWSLKARWIVPVCSPPIENGVVEITGQWVTGVRAGGPYTVDLGDVLVVPGLVNAHTHLDLTGYPRTQSPPETFAAWIRQVIRHRRAETVLERTRAVEAGVEKNLRSGVTLIGDISSDGNSAEILAASKVNATVYHEVLGVDLPRAQASQSAFDAWLGRGGFPDHVRPGISPHAPYSTRLELFSWARNKKLPCQVHLGETGEELELMRDKRGPLVEMLQEIGLWPAPGLPGSLGEVLDALDYSGKPCGAPLALVHANVLPIGMASRIGKEVTLIHCPRTHDWFGRQPFPMEKWLELGTRIALGTDGEACNPDLNVLTEARFLCQKLPALEPNKALEMVTINGARVLGWESLAGTIESGKLADLAVFELENPGGVSDPVETLMGQENDPQKVLWRGAWR